MSLRSGNEEREQVIYYAALQHCQAFKFGVLL